MSSETREHRGQGARKAARRKFRHVLQNKLIVELSRGEDGLSPAAIRFRARVKTDRILAGGSTEVNAHGRGLVKA